MKLFSAVAIFLAVALTQAFAQQDTDNQYVGIYSQIQQADSLESAGQPRQALAGYIEAQTELQKFQKIYPDWDQKIVSYRLTYLAEKIAELTALLPPLTNAAPQMESAAPSTSNSAPDIESQIGGLRAQVQGLQSDNATLEAKLKEALAAQPAAVDAGELAKTQAQIRSLMKENDLLKANLAQISAASAPVAPPKPPQDDARIRELTVEVSTLRARLAVDEMQAVPYTPEETALLKQPEPQPAANSDSAKKSINELPAGSAELVAEAQNYFAAKQFDKAAADYQKILQRDAGNALVLGNLAAIELQQGKLDDAEKHIKSALAQNPNDAYNLSILGYLKFRQEKFDDAFDALSHAAQLDPQNPEIKNYLGVTLSHKGLRAQAETTLREALEIDPNYAAAHNNLAVIYISDQPPSPELARFHYQKALDAGQPRNPDLEKLLADHGVPVNAQ
ncbi:MAG TPA: tetratricopeptide repeat protein [Verrucomicrobiae bacterium]|nr:tetratricopeptide repeat protein [Verrucomicrobiae bacterium]